jgi:hypothetical protein
MIAVGGVEMSIVQVVHVVSVRYCDMSAVRTVDMIVAGVGDAALGLALVPMVVVLMVKMSVVHVVDMVSVRNRDMAAVGAVHMRVFGFGAMVVGG